MHAMSCDITTVDDEGQRLRERAGSLGAERRTRARCVSRIVYRHHLQTPLPIRFNVTHLGYALKYPSFLNTVISICFIVDIDFFVHSLSPAFASSSAGSVSPSKKCCARSFSRSLHRADLAMTYQG